MIIKIRERLFFWFIRTFRIKSHIVMIQNKDHYIYLDYYGQMWKLEHTFDQNIPLRISLILR